MFRAFHEKREEQGFTLIELLVVILIIAILAAIAIPVFLNQRKKGWISQQQSALKNAATAAESYGTQANGDFTGIDESDLTGEGWKHATAVSLTDIGGDGTGYCIETTHSQLDGDVWEVATYDSDTGEPTDADAATPGC